MNKIMISEGSQYEDLTDLIFDKYLGSGVDRDTYVFKPDTNLVIKKALNNPQHNHSEYDIWGEILCKKELSKWFAPCVGISRCGMFMIQERIETKPKRDYPKEIPSFFTDTKYSNYGWLNGKFVCCDYSRFSNIFLDGKPNLKMKKADWVE